jgi:S1-C subfamily serine protease
MSRLSNVGIRAIWRAVFFVVGIAVGIVGAVLIITRGTPAGAISESSVAWRSPEEERQIQVYKNTNEAVVFITTITLTVDPSEIFFSIRPREGTGSGCIIDPKRGIILTNLHVVQDAQQIEISFANGQTAQARRLGVDRETDLAVLQVINPPPGLSGLNFGDSARLEVGQRVLAIGNPFGLNRTLTTGILSSLDRTVRVTDTRTMRGLVQTDAAINPGNSGGALLDLDGRLIGINSAILSSSGDSAGIGFAVPINQIKRVLPDLINKGRVLRPRIGWGIVDTNQGPFVERVSQGSPAEIAGVQPVLRRVERAFLQGYVRDFSRADQVVSINGNVVNSRDEIEDITTRLEPGQKLTVVLKRGGPEGRSRQVVIEPVLQ